MPPEASPDYREVAAINLDAQTKLMAAQGLEEKHYRTYVLPKIWKLQKLSINPYKNGPVVTTVKKSV